MCQTRVRKGDPRWKDKCINDKRRLYTTGCHFLMDKDSETTSADKQHAEGVCNFLCKQCCNTLPEKPGGPVFWVAQHQDTVMAVVLHWRGSSALFSHTKYLVNEVPRQPLTFDESWRRHLSAVRDPNLPGYPSNDDTTYINLLKSLYGDVQTSTSDVSHVSLPESTSVLASEPAEEQQDVTSQEFKEYIETAEPAEIPSETPPLSSQTSDQSSAGPRQAVPLKKSPKQEPTASLSLTKRTPLRKTSYDDVFSRLTGRLTDPSSRKTSARSQAPITPRQLPGKKRYGLGPKQPYRADGSKQESPYTPRGEYVEPVSPLRSASRLVKKNPALQQPLRSSRAGSQRLSQGSISRPLTPRVGTAQGLRDVTHKPPRIAALSSTSRRSSHLGEADPEKIQTSPKLSPETTTKVPGELRKKAAAGTQGDPKKQAAIKSAGPRKTAPSHTATKPKSAAKSAFDVQSSPDPWDKSHSESSSVKDNETATLMGKEEEKLSEGETTEDYTLQPLRSIRRQSQYLEELGEEPSTAVPRLTDILELELLCEEVKEEIALARTDVQEREPEFVIQEIQAIASSVVAQKSSTMEPIPLEAYELAHGVNPELAPLIKPELQQTETPAIEPASEIPPSGTVKIPVAKKAPTAQIPPPKNQPLTKKASGIPKTAAAPAKVSSRERKKGSVQNSKTSETPHTAPQSKPPQKSTPQSTQPKTSSARPSKHKR